MTKTLKKGFTLVELIVVIAIIAILSTVAVVGYSAFIKNANQSKVNQELAQAENVLRAKQCRLLRFAGDEDKVMIDAINELEDSQINLLTLKLQTMIFNKMLKC